MTIEPQYVWTDEDRAVVEATTRVGEDADIEALVAIHNRHLRDLRREREDAVRRLRYIDRAIAMREKAVERLSGT